VDIVKVKELLGHRHITTTQIYDKRPTIHFRERQSFAGDLTMITFLGHLLGSCDSGPETSGITGVELVQRFRFLAHSQFFRL
jgi:hypothetical protein